MKTEAVDEQQIRMLVETWMSATRAGDHATVLGLMTDDVVFLTPGRPPFGKEAFATLAASSDTQRPTFDGRSEIQEIQVSGEWAFMWTRLTVVTTMPGDAAPITRRGHTLSVLRKQRGKWLLARDANLLTPDDQKNGDEK